MDPAEALAAIRLLVGVAPAPPAPVVTWSRLWDLYSADPPVSPNTFKSYGYLWDSHVGAHWGGRDVMATTGGDVAEYRLKRKNDLTRRGGRVTRPATRNREVMFLRTLATFGLKRGHITKNPVATLDDEEPEDNIRETVLTEQQLERARPWLPHLALVYVILVTDSGMRRGEAATLRWDQVDFEAGVICLSRRQTKARRSRYTMLSPRAAELLQNLPRLGDCVFHNAETGQPYKPNYFLTKWRYACDRAGVKGPDGNVTLHDLRRTFATTSRRAGIQESEIMAMGGWTTAEVFTRYNVVSLADIQLARKKMEAHLRRSARRPARKSEESGLTCSGKSISIETARTDR